MSTPNPVPVPSFVSKVVAFVKVHYVKIVFAILGIVVGKLI